jgi:radical SAM protein with 4Fe4S-binding SPASM domain
MNHYKKIVDELEDMGVNHLSLFGFGEPLLDRELEQKIRYATAKRMMTYITTNASLLDYHRACSLIDAGLKNIRFSVHGITEKTYKKVHKKILWDDVIRNISDFVTINWFENAQITTHVTCLAMNNENPSEVVEYWKKKGIDHVEVWKPHNWGGAKDYRKVNPRLKTCGRPTSGPIQIQADGNLIPCCFLTNGEVIYGNTHKKTIREILQGEIATAFRRAHDIGEFGNYPCATCDQRNENDEPLLISTRGVGIARLSTSKYALAV